MDQATLSRPSMQSFMEGTNDTQFLPVNILLAEDHGIVNEGIKAILEAESNLNVIASANNGHEVMELLAKMPVNLVFIDYSLPEMNGLECTKLIKKHFPEVKVLVFSIFDYESDAVELLDAGADAYIMKNSTRAELLFAIHKVTNHGKYIGPEFTLNLLSKRRLEKSISDPKPAVVLTDSEMEVLELMAQGFINSEMASKLFVSVRTIETRRKKILEKTGTTNTATLIRHAVLTGLIK